MTVSRESHNTVYSKDVSAILCKKGHISNEQFCATKLDLKEERRETGEERRDTGGSVLCLL